MVKNPEIGGQYWFVTDIWERFCPVPVTIVAVNEEYGALLIRWDIGESEYFEQYEGVWPNELYETQADAAEECRRRNALPCGYVEKVVNYLENNATSLPVPTESVEQQCLFRWAAFQSGRFPELALLYHVPNGGSRKKAEAGRFRAEGVKAGVPDLCLPVARGGFHGLYIELKRQKGSKTSDDQKAWLSNLEKQGYFVALCKGWEAAAKVITEYLTMGGKEG